MSTARHLTTRPETANRLIDNAPPSERDDSANAGRAYHVRACPRAGSLMLSVIMAAADREIVFRPNDLRANAEATSLKADLYGAGLDAGVPDISHDPGEQRPGLTPIGTVVILDLADRAGLDAVNNATARNTLKRAIYRSAGFVAPRRVVIHAIGATAA